MRIVVALDERTLLKSGAFEVSESRSTNVQAVARALADLAQDHQVIVAHGNGLQENLLAMQTAACLSGGLSNIEMLLTETEGMIGYLIEQELLNALPEGADLATIVTRVEVDRDDPAFDKPTNAVGPSFSAECAKIMQHQHGWTMSGNAQGGLSRMIPSPRPRAILSSRMIEQLADSGACVICSGGGGIPVFRNEAGMMEGVAAIVDKDQTAALLAQSVNADVLLLLTHESGVFLEYGQPGQRAIRSTTPDGLAEVTGTPSSMKAKIAAAVRFVRGANRVAGIGLPSDARAILEGRAGTRIVPPPMDFRQGKSHDAYGAQYFAASQHGSV